MLYKKEDIYCLILYPFKQKGYCMNRGYVVIDAPWKEITMGDVIEVSKDFCPTFQHPEWAVSLDEDGHHRVAIWTNFYEPK